VGGELAPVAQERVRLAGGRRVDEGRPVQDVIDVVAGPGGRAAGQRSGSGSSTAALQPLQTQVTPRPRAG
jgi:hypothetical protein